MVGATSSPMKRVQQLWKQLPQSPPPSVVIDEDIKISNKLSMIDTVSNDNNTNVIVTAVPTPATTIEQPKCAVPSSPSEIQHYSSSSDPDDDDKTLTQEIQEKVDISLLYEQIGKLTENLKEVMHNTAAIPGMQTSIATLQVDVKTKLADLSGRMLIAEEDILQIKKDISANNTYMTQVIKPLVKQINRDKILETVVENSAKFSNLETQNQNDTLKYNLDEEQIESIIEKLLSSKLVEMDQPITDLTESDISAQFSALQQETSTKLQKLSSDMKSVVVLDQELLDRVSRLEDLAKSSKDQPSHPVKPPDKPAPDIIDHDFIIIGDSNTTVINMKDIAHNLKRKRFTRYTIPDAIEFVRTAVITSQPKKVLLHLGTNDIVSANGDVEELTTNYKILFDETRRRFPKARIFVSSIFNRKSKSDRLNRPIQEMNLIIESICDITPRMTLLDNSNIGHNNMYDPKHIDEDGLDIFLWNIRHTILGEVPRGKTLHHKDSYKKW